MRKNVWFLYHYCLLYFLHDILVVQSFLILHGRRLTIASKKPSTSIVFNHIFHHTATNDYERRKFIEWTLSSLVTAGGTNNKELTSHESIANNEEESITIPLEWISSLNAYVLYFYLFDSKPEKFGAILDTGSPFLTVPSYCDRSKWGCYRPELTKDSGLSNTFERFDNNEGTVVWRKSSFSFKGATGSMMGPKELVFGVLDNKLMAGSGGVFFGLIKKTDRRIRPSFLGQLNVKSFKIDLKSEDKSLILATSNMIKDNDYIPLVMDLNKRYKDPVVHYTAMSHSVMVNGIPLLQPMLKKNKPTFVIFDTGVTGMVVSQELFQERYNIARKNKEKSLWGSVDITFQTQRGELISLSANKPVTTPLGEKPWPGFNANLIVLGLAFLEGHTMIVDIDDLKLVLG